MSYDPQTFKFDKVFVGYITNVFEGQVRDNFGGQLHQSAFEARVNESTNMFLSTLKDVFSMEEENLCLHTYFEPPEEDDEEADTIRYTLDAQLYCASLIRTLGASWLFDPVILRDALKLMFTGPYPAQVILNLSEKRSLL